MTDEEKKKVIGIMLDIDKYKKQPTEEEMNEYLKREAELIEENRKRSKMEQERIKMSREKLYQEFTI